MTRTCSRCGIRDSVSDRGVPRCAECKLICRCGAPKVNSQYCATCQRQISKGRPQRVKTCGDCGREFRTKGANNYCPMCVHERRKHPCSTCGVLVDVRAKQCMPCWGKEHRGQNSPSYIRGKSRMKLHGYVLVSGYRDHPKSANGYVREHVVVMETMLGRYLVPGENVHHKNGVRDDNRPENLELWTRKQPAGQRVEDMVAWAKELLARYEPEALAVKDAAA